VTGGPSSLDWAIMTGAGRWGVTVLQANAEMDAGDIWASAEFTMPGGSKSSVYRFSCFFDDVRRTEAFWDLFRPVFSRSPYRTSAPPDTRCSTSPSVGLGLP
jgi:hypothetical protein